MIRNSSGQTKISTLLYLLVAIIVVYVVIKVLPPYMDYYAMEDEITQQAELAEINSDTIIRNDIISKANDLEIVPDALVVTKVNSRLSVYMSWSTNVDFGYGINRDFEFEIDTSPGDLE